MQGARAAPLYSLVCGRRRKRQQSMRNMGAKPLPLLLLLVVVMPASGQDLPRNVECSRRAIGLHGRLAASPWYGGRVVNSRAASRGQFPYHALVLSDKTLLCSGALLSKYAVLTAAQCVHTFRTYLVHLGGLEPFSDGDGQTINGESVEVHPGYSTSRQDDDIAVVFLETPAILNSNVQPVRLPTDMKIEELVGKRCLITGWGRTDASSECAEELRYAPLVVQPNNKCGSYFPTYNATSSLCAGGMWGASVCNGDNGSPLVVGGNKGYTVIGVASFVFSEHCLPDFPSGFTSVTAYLPWISKTTNIRPT